ncbi:hypothetical protein M569_16275 [Genlisea aurea]|uniref:Myb-like domain-containing protein n=1 Tax=Genlisea aurea TaxID=192259 RepID=S8D791_9LAMI|nr:hypothetical protein M569_16275 [Genlisea aurea]
MCEEHGYQRSGKKCREKFENLYKYYKKTKEGKAGRQDGKHYRFFRQLEALYGGESNNNNNTSESHQFQFNFQQKLHGQKLLSETSLSLSNYSEPEYTTSSSEEQDPKNKKKKNWKAKIKDFIDARMKRLMERQDLWMDRMMRTMENNEKERMSREEEWRSQHIAMMEHEHELWDRERAWIRSRDATLMETLHRVASGKEVPPIIPDNHHAYRGGTTTTESPVDIWPEMEINKLIQLRTSMEMKFQQRGVVPEEALWEEISAKMRCCGHERSGFTCKHKWEAVNNYLLKCSKKRKEENNSKGSSTYFEPFSQPEEALEQSFISLSDHHHHHHHHQHHNGSR